MFTAENARAAISKTLETCEGLDSWIEGYLVEQFTKKTNYVVIIPDWTVTSMGWGVNTFTSAMRVRGFTVDYYCEDSPCGSCYFAIKIPD